jgi:hypothetical protein
MLTLFNTQKPLFLKFQSNMNRFKEIIVVKDFEIKNGLLGFYTDIFLIFVKFLSSSTVRKVW